MPSSKSALVVIDMLNPYDHEDADRLCDSVETVVEPIKGLIARAGEDDGQVTEQCILYSALDAYVRHLEVCVPRDGVAHIHEELAAASLQMMERNMDAEICDAKEVEWRK